MRGAGTFVDDEDFCSEPSSSCLFVLANLSRKVLGALDTETDSSERMNGDTANVAGSDT